MSNVKFVYFDLGNVILNFSHQRMVAQVAQATALEPDIVQAHLFTSGLEDRYETGEFNSQQFFEKFCARVTEHTSTGPGCGLDSFIHACGDIFWLNADIMPVISQLWLGNLPLGILSNTCEAHWTAAKHNFPLIDDFFDTTITSYRSQSMKPDRKIYQDAIQASGVSAHEIFFTDDKQENVAAAADAGIDAVVFQSAGQLIEELRSRSIKIG
jgi:FMN phosphatase YigB (HAD superfamily)